jgi:hypothetical protein
MPLGGREATQLRPCATSSPSTRAPVLSWRCAKATPVTTPHHPLQLPQPHHCHLATLAIELAAVPTTSTEPALPTSGPCRRCHLPHHSSAPLGEQAMVSLFPLRVYHVDHPWLVVSSSLLFKSCCSFRIRVVYDVEKERPSWSFGGQHS